MKHARPSGGSDRIYLGFLIGLSVGILTTSLASRIVRRVWDRDVEFFRVVRDIAAEEFVDEVDGDKLLDDALRGMMQGLDRYSNYYGPDELAHLDRETHGEFRGIGVVFRPPTQKGQILFPYPESPAALAGVRVGDTLVTIDGVQVAEMEPGELQRTIQRWERPEMPTRVRGLDGEERDLVLEPQQVLDPTIRHARMVDSERGVAHVSILSFTHRTTGEFDDHVARLKEEGMQALVLDLRANPGGILESALEISNRFIAEGPLLITHTRKERHVTQAVAEKANLTDLPLVVLVDGNSASASEVLAGAVQDHGAGAVVGEPTYGKGKVQTLTRIDGDRAVVKMTTATYLTPSGRRIERSEDGTAMGVTPDVEVAISEEVREGIYRFLSDYDPPTALREIIRRWEESEDLELLSEPPEDPQLQAAVALLTGESLANVASGD